MPIPEQKHIPKVSIGMPVYNGEKYIREALDSLLAQTLTNFELIISDNASTDTTAEICKEYAKKDSRIRYVRQIENLGPSANFEFVLREAKASYFMWAACDDVWSADWLLNLYELIVKSKAGAAFGQVLPINHESKLIPHISINKSFRFVGNPFFRRLCFYLKFEGEGKANLFYSLFRKDGLTELKLNSYVYDYSIIYNLLSEISFESARNVYLYKRDHPAGAGNLMNKGQSFFSKISRLIFPVPKALLMEYFEHANWLEKIIMVLLTPYKFLLSYLSRMHFVNLNYLNKGK